MFLSTAVIKNMKVWLHTIGGETGCTVVCISKVCISASVYWTSGVSSVHCIIETAAGCAECIIEEVCAVVCIASTVYQMMAVYHRSTLLQAGCAVCIGATVYQTRTLHLLSVSLLL